MSAYKVVECEVNTQEGIIAGLIDLGIPHDLIEIHKEAVPLNNWQGKKTGQKGNIVVRRQNFKKYTASRYNADLGFEKKENGYQMHINQEENRWWQQRDPRFKQVAASVQVIAKAKKKGYKVKKTEKNGNIKLQLVKNF